MAVKRMVGKTKPMKVKKKAVRIVKNLAVVDKTVLTLPTEKKVVSFNLLEYILLVYGREKIGKTTLLSSFPDAMFITTEPGTKGLEIFEFLDRPVKDWGEIMQAVVLLEKSKKRFKYVIIDTADRAYDMCLDWVCSKRGIEYPGQDDQGREDYGKSWRAVKSEFVDMVHRIIRTGRGIAFTSHMKETEIKTKSGDKYDRIYPSMSNQARTVIEALVDLFFFADYVKDIHGSTRRILITEGDESIWAGHRKCAGDMPRFLPLDEDNGYEVIAEAFRGEHPGVDPSEISVSKQTTRTTGKFLHGLKAKDAIEKHQKKKGGAKRRKAG